VPEGVEVWDETNGPARWARGAEAVCVDRLKALREALRRYANDHAGQWPEALRPALAPYVTSPDDFRCPLSVAGADAGFEYHRPGKMLTQMVLEAWNRRHADPAARLDLRLNGARPPVLECRMSPGPIFSLNADGIVYRWYPQPAAAMATAAPAGPAAIDPAAAPILKALAERDRRLSELEVTYDYRATHLVPWELPAFGPGSGKPTRQPAGDFINSHITWARKGEKMLRDERSRLPGGLERQRWITDGETVLVQRVSRPGQPLSAPSAQSSPWELRGSIADLGLSDGFGALPELPNGRWQVRALGSRITGGDQCVGLEVTDPRRPGSPDRLWFDPSHGYVLRREERYQNGKLQIEMTATQPHEWAPGIFLATRLVTIGYLGPQGQAGAPTHRWTAIVRQVTVGGLPDSLFEPVPP
jgi:hypothetical protein